MGKLEDLLFTLEICRKSLPLEAHSAHYDRLEEIENILKKELNVTAVNREPGQANMSIRQNILEQLEAGNNFFKPINDSEVLNHLLFLTATLKLDDLPRITHLPKYVLGLVTATQKHRVEVCIEQIHSNQMFPAFHELYDFIQDNWIGNSAPFTNEEMIVLKYLVDLFTDKLLKKKRG